MPASAFHPRRPDTGAALAQASERLANNPAEAMAIAQGVLAETPGQPQARLIVGSALRRLGDAKAARQALERLALDHPNWSVARCELGLALRALGRTAEAEACFRAAVSPKPSPDMAPAWRALGDLQMAHACESLARKDFKTARALLDDRVEARPKDVAALRLLAELEDIRGRYGEAEALLERALAIEPEAPGLRHNLVTLLFKQFKTGTALVHIEAMLDADPASPQLQALRAAALSHLGETDQAAAIYERLLARQPAEPNLWLRYGDTLKIAGRQQDCIAAYNRAIQISPRFGKAYWSLANLKAVRFSDEQIGIMQSLLDDPATGDDDRLHLHYALGKALEDADRFAASFRHYEEGGKLRLIQAPYDASHVTTLLERSQRVFTRAFFEKRRGWGHLGADPIFVVGLPRSGSTLVEQILSSHSSVEGTMELPDLGQIAASLGPDEAGGRGGYPERIEDLDGEALAALGRTYLRSTAHHRKTERPFFIDKMPNNFLLVGLLHLILPNARIIDVRRAPMATCFSAFKQLFPTGQRFSSRQEDVGRYYREYVALMDHFDNVLPGRVYRLRYERLVDDPETEIRNLLDHCGLAFEPACLNFHETERAVRTASSEQVRRPIFRDGVDQWRNYEPWLAPMKAALGADVLLR